MIATGTGLAPMISMLQALPDEIPKLLIFGGRHEHDLYYLDLLKSFQNLQLRTCVSRPSDSYEGVTGRVTSQLTGIHPEDEVYICGNPDMAHEVVAILHGAGHFHEKIFHEDFTLAAKPLPLYQSILFEGNLPGIQALQKLLVYGGSIGLASLYFLGTKYQFL